MAHHPRIYSTLAALALVWGVAFVGIKWALRDLSPTELLVARFLLTSAILSVLMIFYPKARPRFPRGSRIRIVILAVCGVPLYHLPLNWGEQHTTAQIASLIIATAPILVAVGGVKVLGERLTLTRIVGLGCSFLGVVVLTLGTRSEPGVEVTIPGVLAVAIATITWAVYTIVAKPLMDRIPAMTVTSTTLLLGSLSLIPFLTPATFRSIADASAGTLAWVAVLGAGSSVLGYLLFVWLVRHLDASQSGMILYLVPVVGVAAGALILDEPLGWPVAAAAALVLLGIRLTERPVPPAPAPAVPSSEARA